MYSGVVHYGVVVAVSPDEVILRDGGKTSTLKLSNLQILGDDDMKRYKEAKYGVTSRDYSVVFPAEADEEMISGLLRAQCPYVMSVRVKDVYVGEKIGAGFKSVCFGVEILQDDVRVNEAGVRGFFTGIGGRLR